jgi:DNA-binding NarL/FixJ family response regulator
MVLHARHDARIPFAAGRELAALLPGARFVPLDSANHVLLPDEPAWAEFHGELAAFLGEPDAQPCLDGVSALTQAERAVLQLLAQGLDNRAIAAQLGKSEKTVRNQVSSIFAKLGIGTRSQAIVLAREAGIGGS